MIKEKTIAIITHAFSSRNYGQILQAYALHKYLEMQGHRPYIIDYRPGLLEYTLQKKAFVSRLKWVIKNLPFVRNRFLNKQAAKFRNESVNNRRQFDEFKSKYLHYSKLQYTTYSELKKNPPQADLYITGSDQVWGLCAQNPKPYLLAFTDSPHKMSYAASFGRSSLNDYELSTYQQELAKYKSIGVRELTGLDICKKLQLPNCHYTPDPTILLEPAEWKKLMPAEKLFQTDKKKIFIYSCYLQRDELIGKFVGVKGMDDYEIIIEDVVNHDADIAQLSLGNWIRAIYEADYVITNSFHATMFSLYLNTPFISLKNIGAKAKMNTRIESILSQLKLENRSIPINAANEEIFKILQSPVDWERVNKEMSALRQIGYTYLQQNL